jgi:hypothetical protein
VSLALWFHFDSIPNSTVKRSCGDDTLGVASWDNSSMPRLLFKQNDLFFKMRPFFFNKIVITPAARFQSMANIFEALTAGCCK